jgi:type II restriction/modification system DNA methylase subunit YeeA
MTADAFIAKWSKVELTERSAAQAHFLDLCELVGHPKPQDADPKGDSFTFERGASKQSGGDGWADVWKQDFFGWEYKGRHKDLDAAYDQLLEYRADLNNPPLLVVCDMDIIRVRTNFNNAPTRTYELTLETLARKRSLEILDAVFFAPDKLRPGVTSEAITEHASGHFAEIAESMRKRGLEPQAVAHFLVRVVFCLFAEDVGLLERGLFTQLVTRAGGDPKKFARYVADLFSAMATGGDFLLEPIRHFNGSLFDGTPVLELTVAEIAAIGAVANEDWSAVDVSISGTLFERGLDPAKRSQLGSRYTSRAHIETTIEPVVLAPLRREWATVRAKAESLLVIGKKQPRSQAENLVVAFLEHLKTVRVLDPAGGSGNFLYVTLQALLELEKEVNHFLREHGFTPQFPQVNPLQLYCLEIDPYAHDLSQTVVWIGYIQWLRANGYGFPAEPILKGMSANFRCADALFTDWPGVDFIVGNPPFLGGKKLRTGDRKRPGSGLGDEYVEKLFATYHDRVPPEADLCCYWFEKARQQVQDGKCRRAGLLATQAIRGGANREVLKRIKETGDIFFAESDRDWILAGVNVHVSLVGFDDGAETLRSLDGRAVVAINPNLTATADVTTAKQLQANLDVAFMGTTKGGAFDIPEELALEFIRVPNVNGKPSSDVVVPWVNGMDLTQRPSGTWIIDYGVGMAEADAVYYESPFEYLRRHVKPQRESSRTTIKEWWLHERRREEMRLALAPLPRFLCTTRVSKYRLFVWLQAPTLPDSATFAFARADDYFFGVLQSRAHEIWARVQGTQVRERESGFRYTPTTCFETFPFPFPDDLEPSWPEPVSPPPQSKEQTELDRFYAENLAAKNYFMGKEDPPPYGSPSSSALCTPQFALDHRAAIAAAAKHLNEEREVWLNPPELTETRTLEFPGSSSGPWARYVDLETVDAETGVGTVRYPRLEPRDAECAAKLKKRTLTNLYNERPAWLDLAHKKLDAAVAAAYGWPADLSDEQILERLLALNLARATEEATAANVTKPKA